MASFSIVNIQTSKLNSDDILTCISTIRCDDNLCYQMITENVLTENEVDYVLGIHYIISQIPKLMRHCG